MKLRKTQAHPDDNVIIEAEVKKLKYTYYSVSNALIIPLHEVKGGHMPSKPPQWFEEWSKQQFAPLVKKIDNIERKVDAILECPTIKKEINLKSIDEVK